LKFLQDGKELFLGFEGADVSDGCPCSIISYSFGIIGEDETPSRSWFYNYGESHRFPERGERYADLFFGASSHREGSYRVAKAIIEDAPESMWFSIILD
jgi:hypothetical protein